jgi:gamma-glutamylcyclotransferase (GGCT)/AIG2-like uncharacterized protein YtfP
MLKNDLRMPAEFIFVYGTLRRETATNMHNALSRHCEYSSEGHMQGKLYEVDRYPGAVESDNPKDKVYGEIYRIINSDLVLPKLDEYEECTDKFPEPHEYIRKKLPITLSGSGSVTAWVYVFNHDVSNLIRIDSGDYLLPVI